MLSDKMPFPVITLTAGPTKIEFYFEKFSPVLIFCIQKKTDHLFINTFLV